MSPTILGPKLDAMFEVERELGPTDRGTLFAASARHGADDVAIELIPVSHGRDLRDRISESLRLARRLDGVHVLHVIDRAVTPTGALAVVRECSFASLDAEVRARPLALRDAVTFTLEACEAIAEAYALGFAHGDVRARNVHLVRNGGAGPLAKLWFTEATIGNASSEDRYRDVEGLARMLQGLLSSPIDDGGDDGLRTVPGPIAALLGLVFRGEIRDVATFAAGLAPFAAPEQGSLRTIEFLLARAGLLADRTERRSVAPMPATSLAIEQTRGDLAMGDAPLEHTHAEARDRRLRRLVLAAVASGLGALGLSVVLRPSPAPSNTTHLTQATTRSVPQPSSIPNAVDAGPSLASDGGPSGP